jgi:Virulence factor
MPDLVLVSWRDIPAQVTAKAGRRAARRRLGDRFQEAIDAAAMRAGLHGTDAYLREWRRVTRPCGDDLEAEVAAEAWRLEQDYDNERLDRLVRANGKEQG